MLIRPSNCLTHWTTVPLGEVVEFLDNQRQPITEKDRVPGPYPYYGANGQQDSVAEFIFDEPLILVAEDGGHFGDPNKTIAYQVDGKCWVNNHAHVLRPKKSINIRYLCRHLEQYDVAPFITGTTRGKLTKGAASRIPILLPPLEEQCRIAAILDRADAVRRKRQEAIQLTEELLRSAFLEMFGDPVTNPKGWQVKQLQEITSKITDGVHFRPNYSESGIPFISVKDITTGRLLFNDSKYISKEDHHKFTKRCKPELGDILYTKVGATYGRPALVDVSSEFSIYVSVCLIKPLREVVRPQFLKEVMATPAIKHQADLSIKGIGVPDLHLNMIKQFLIPVPDLSIQDEFLHKTEVIKKALFAEENHLCQLENLFNSLLQQAFQGEL